MNGNKVNQMVPWAGDCSLGQRSAGIQRQCPPLHLKPHGARMPDLYLDVLCHDCRACHDLYNADLASHARGCSYFYTCPVTGRALAIRISFPDGTATGVPPGAVSLRWVADASQAA
jgi:hypothetical protein